jgi:hypothetical protein
VHAEPAEWSDGFDRELAERVKEAERYEDGSPTRCCGLREVHDDKVQSQGASRGEEGRSDAMRPWDGDVAGDARNFSHLIDALVSAIHDVKRDGSENEELDRASALAWIARDLAEELMVTRK